MSAMAEHDLTAGPVPDDVFRAVSEFVARVSDLPVPARFRVTFEALRRRRTLRSESWYYQPGVYAFFTGSGALRYVGRALVGSGGLSSRASDHLKPKYLGYNPSWDTVSTDQEAFAELYAFSDADEIWVPSLEMFLIGRFRQHLVNARSA